MEKSNNNLLKKPFLKKFYLWFLSACGIFILGFYIFNPIENFLKENGPQAYIAVLVTDKSIDFDIPIDFNKGFRAKTNNQNYFQSKDKKRVDIKLKEDFLSESKSSRIIDDLVKDENCLLIVCNANSTLTNTNIDLLINMKAKMPIIMPIATDNNILKKTENAAYNAILRMLPNNGVQAETIQRMVFQLSDKRVVAIYCDQDNQSYSINLSRDIAEKIRKNGGNVIIEELIGPSNSIFNSLNVLTNKKLKPDIIVYAGTSHHAFLLIDQLSYLNINIPVIFTDGCLVASIFQQASSKYEGKCYILSPARLKDVSSYQDSYGLIGQDTYELLRTIFNNTNATRNEVFKYIEGSQKEINFDGAAGSYKFENGENIGRKYNVYRIIGGRTQEIIVH